MNLFNAGKKLTLKISKRVVVLMRLSSLSGVSQGQSGDYQAATPVNNLMLSASYVRMSENAYIDMRALAL